MVNFFKPNKDDGTVLHLNRSGKWEKCTIPVGCIRHINLAILNNNPAQDYPEWSSEAWDYRDTILSVENYNGYAPKDYDPMDDMKVGTF